MIRASQDTKFCDTLISYTNGYEEISEPIALIKSNILNFNHQSKQINVNNNMPAAYFETIDKLIIDEETEDKPFKIASVKLGQICPCCNKTHTTDNDKKVNFYHNQREIVFRCFRNRKNTG